MPTLESRQRASERATQACNAVTARVQLTLSHYMERAVESRRHAVAVQDAALVTEFAPARVPTHMTTREQVILHRLAREAQGTPRALEIGSYQGASAVFLAAGLRHRGGTLYCVDTWRNDTMDEGPRDTYADFQRHVAGLDNVVPLRKSSNDLAGDDVELPLGIVHLDGDHSYEGVKRDFTVTEPWLEPNGLMIFHDAVHFQGVARTIGEALATGEWQLDEYVDNLLVLRKQRPIR